MTWTEYAIAALVVAMCATAGVYHLLTIRPSQYCPQCKRWFRGERCRCDDA